MLELQAGIASPDSLPVKMISVDEYQNLNDIREHQFCPFHFLVVFWKPIYLFQWGSNVFLCYKKSVPASNAIAYKAGKWTEDLSQLNKLVGAVYIGLARRDKICSVIYFVELIY